MRKLIFITLLLSLIGMNFLSASPGYSLDIIALASGGDHTVALRVDGTVWTWGRNANGQLGDGSFTDKNVPTRVAILRDIVSVAAGGAYSFSTGTSLAVRADGTVWAWGWNANGQLGDGTTTDQPIPVQVKDPSDPSTFLTNVIAVAAGERHSLALKANGTVWAWGYNANGQLGDGTAEWRPTPVRVKDPSDASGFLTGVKAIAAGSLHSIALKNDKTVWTWGSQGYMQLGRASHTGFTPQNVAGQVAGMTEVKAIAGAWEHTVVLKEDGTVWAAGRNLEGQLGDGTTIGSSLSPLKLFVQVIDPADEPDPTGYLTGIVAIDADDRHTVAVKQNGSVYGWGWNYGGKLCDSITDNKLTPMKMKDPSDPTTFLSEVDSVTAGGVFNLMLKGDGTIWGCGYNYWGQMGDGTWISPRTSPVEAKIPKTTIVVLSGNYGMTPGEEATLLIEYTNWLNQQLEDAVLVFEFPKVFRYVSSTQGGIFRDDLPENQVFWKLENIQPGESGRLFVRVKPPWGIPAHSKGSFLADIGARNLQSNLNVDDYLNYLPNIVSTTRLNVDQVNAHLSSNPLVADLLNHALESGYLFEPVARETTYRSGESVVRLALIDGVHFSPAFLYVDGEFPFIEKFQGNTLSRFNQTGGYSVDLQDGTILPWGSWGETPFPPGIIGQNQALYRCISNCTVNRVPEWMISQDWNTYRDISSQEACTFCSQTIETKTEGGHVIVIGYSKEACAKCAKLYIEDARLYDEKVSSCVTDCNRNPALHECTQPQKFCTTPWYMAPYNWFKGSSEDYLAVTIPCKDGTLMNWRGYRQEVSCLLDLKCIDGVCVDRYAGCPQASQSNGNITLDRDQAVSQGVPTLLCDFFSSAFEIFTAHDPNSKFADSKDIAFPGQKLTYTIEYENVGTGTAFGVFILDDLDPNLDDTKLTIQDGGTYFAPSRLLSWSIGTLPAGGKGSVSFSVNVNSVVPSGTEIVNHGKIYFPSANEVTPTNPVTHVVKSIAAEPQTIETTASTPTPITLSGRDPGGGALAYQIITGPRYGTVTGTPPAVIYSSMAEFNGQDEFFFVVNNGLGDSDPARIWLKVNPNPSDTTPPAVVKTDPENGAINVHVKSTPFLTNPDQYTPIITAAFSEPIDDTTLTASTFTVSGGITGGVFYDEKTKSALFTPTKPLVPSTTYVVRLKTGIKDKKGNPLTAEYSWQFTTESLVNLQATLPDLANEIDFGDQAVGVLSAAKTVFLSSTGFQNLNIGTVSVIGTHSNDFKVTGDTCSGKTLEPSQDCTLQVAFQPLSAGQRMGSLSILSNDPDYSPANIPLKGQGIGSNPPWFLWLPLILRN